MLFLPWIVSLFQIESGTFQSPILGTALPVVYYVVRFIDTEIVAEPMSNSSRILSLSFLMTCFALIIQAIWYPFAQLTGSVVTALFFLLFGLRLSSIQFEPGSHLEKEHPGMYHEVRVGGPFNVIIGSSLGIIYVLSEGAQSGNLLVQIYGLFAAFPLVLLIIPAIRYLSHVQRESWNWKNTKKGRKTLFKIGEDQWNLEVSSQSRIGSLVSRLPVPLCIATMYSGVTILNLGVDTSNRELAISGLVALGWAYSIFAYNLRRSGLTVKGAVRIIRGSRSKIPTIEDLQKRVGILISVYVAGISSVFGLTRFLSNPILNSTIVTIGQVAITQLDNLYASFMLLLVLILVLLYVRFESLSDQKASPQYRTTVSRIVSGTFTVFYVLTGGITGAVAHAFGVPPALDASLVAAWIITTNVVYYYLRYLKGGEGFEAFWEKRKSAIVNGHTHADRRKPQLS